VTANKVISFPIVVSGPSGVGKTTLCHGLMEKDSRLAFSISATTRRARPNEQHGKDYFFVSKQEFERMKAGGELAENARVHGQYYGTPRNWLDEQLDQGMSILLDIDVQGGVQIMEAYPQAVSIFVVPPSFAVLEERLRNRKSETEDALAERMSNAMGEMEYITRYTYIVANDVISEAVAKMEHIVRGERCKRDRLLKGTTWKELLESGTKGVSH
jgi:guanylate kinase